MNTINDFDERLHTLIIHNSNYSLEDLILNKDNYSTFFDIGDYVIIYDPNDPLSQLGKQHRLIFHIRSQTFQTITTGNRFEISISKSTAETLKFNPLNRYAVCLHKIDVQDAYIDFVELSFKKQFLQRGNMWRFKNSILMKPLHVGQLIVVDGMQAQIQELGHLGVAKTSGVILKDTNIIFRSKSTRIIWLIQISKEMWEYDENGFLYFEKFLNKFVDPLLDRWKTLGVSHSLTVIFFARSFNDNNIQFQGKTNKISFEDHFKVVIENSSEIDKLGCLKILKQEFWSFPQNVGWSVNQNQIISKSDSDICNRFPTDAYNGNFLEAINTTLNILDKHYMDRDLQRTGNSLVMVSAGTGFYKVRPSLSQITKQRMMDSGIGIDFISLSQPPLHVTPLFLVDCSNESMTDFYEVPHWINVSFVDCDRDSSATIENYSSMKTDSSDEFPSVPRQHYRWTGLSEFSNRLKKNSNDSQQLTYDKWGKLFKPLPFPNIIKGSLTMSKLLTSEVFCKNNFTETEINLMVETFSLPEIFIDVTKSSRKAVYNIKESVLSEWGIISFNDLFQPFLTPWSTNGFNLNDLSSYLSTLAKYKYRHETSHEGNVNNSDFTTNNSKSRVASFLSANSNKHTFKNNSQITKQNITDASKHLDISTHSGRSVSFKNDLDDIKIARIETENDNNSGQNISSSSESSSMSSSVSTSVKSGVSLNSFDEISSSISVLRKSNNTSNKLYLKNGIVLFRNNDEYNKNDGDIFVSFLNPCLDDDELNRKIDQYDNRSISMTNYKIESKIDHTDSFASELLPKNKDKNVEINTLSQPKSIIRQSPDRSTLSLNTSKDVKNEKLDLQNSKIYSSSPRGYQFSNNIPVIKSKSLFNKRFPSNDMDANRKNSKFETQQMIPVLSTSSNAVPKNNKLHALSPTKSNYNSSNHVSREVSTGTVVDENDPKLILKEYRRKAQTNPFKKEEGDKYLKERTHNRRRWSYVFPVGDLGKSMTTYYGLNWKSLTQPAILPIITDYIPEINELKSNYEFQSIYELQFDIANSVFSSVETLMTEMVCQRLSMEYQLVEIKDQSPYFKYGDSEFSDMKGTSFYILSMGHRIQFLMCDKSKVKVSSFLSNRGKNDNNRIYNYQYNLWVPQLQQYQKMSQTFYQFPTPEFIWNNLDYQLSGSGGILDLTQATNKSKRLRFNIIPNHNSKISPITETEYFSKMEKLIEFLSKYTKGEIKVQYLNYDSSSFSQSPSSKHIKSSSDYDIVTVWLRQPKIENKNPNWANLKHDTVISINKIFHLEIHWLVCDSWLMEEFINILYRRSSNFGLRIIQIPEFFCTSNLQIHPFRSQPYIKLVSTEFYDNYINILNYKSPTLVIENLFFKEEYGEWIRDDSQETNWNHYGLSNHSDQSQLTLLFKDEPPINNRGAISPSQMKQVTESIQSNDSSYSNSALQVIEKVITSIAPNLSNINPRKMKSKQPLKVYDKQYCHRRGFAAVRFGSQGFVWLLNTGVRVNDITQSSDEKKQEAIKTLSNFQSICESISLNYEIVLEIIESALS